MVVEPHTEGDLGVSNLNIAGNPDLTESSDSQKNPWLLKVLGRG
jgi:hypothetical protein